MKGERIMKTSKKLWLITMISILILMMGNATYAVSFQGRSLSGNNLVLGTKLEKTVTYNMWLNHTDGIYCNDPNVTFPTTSEISGGGGITYTVGSSTSYSGNVAGDSAIIAYIFANPSGKSGDQVQKAYWYVREWPQGEANELYLEAVEYNNNPNKSIIYTATITELTNRILYICTNSSKQCSHKRICIMR